MTILKHLALILFAYLLAAVVTGYVVDISLLASSDHLANDARKNLLGFGLFISFLVAYFAACPAAATVALGEYFHIRRWWYYALAGSAIGLGLGTIFRPPEFFPWLGLGFGPVSGVIYWAIAGRRAGLAENNARMTVVVSMAIVSALLLVFTWAWFIGEFF